ncbi:hypothetical protein B0H12DRAFT_1135532 [Mycena haematopus]|nr:hypothetical protein B0H12DRAFT_1135532 [Mycena haematopus]
MGGARGRTMWLKKRGLTISPLYPGSLSSGVMLACRDGVSNQDVLIFFRVKLKTVRQVAWSRMIS